MTRELTTRPSAIFRTLQTYIQALPIETRQRGTNVDFGCGDSLELNVCFTWSCDQRQEEKENVLHALFELAVDTHALIQGPDRKGLDRRLYDLEKLLKILDIITVQTSSNPARPM